MQVHSDMENYPDDRTIQNFDKYKFFFEKFSFVLDLKIQEVFLTLKNTFCHA